MKAAKWLCSPPKPTWQESEFPMFMELFASIKSHRQKMTRPVLIRVDDEHRAYSMMFRVDDTFEATADDEVSGLFVVRSADMRVRSATFGGYATEDECRQQLENLLETCTLSKPPSVWYVAVYNGPYRRWGRTNKVMFEIK
jgi:hypothetical protein